MRKIKTPILCGILLYIATLVSPHLAVAEDKAGVVYKYKKYERFDLGNLEIKGEIIAPGDLSVLERERKVFKLQLLDRKEFDEEMIQNIIFLR